MLNLNEQNVPLKEIMHQTSKLDFYDCDGVVAPWFRQLLSAEMNYFAEMVEMPFVKGEFCVVSMGTSRSLAPGRLSIHLYPSRIAMQECVVRERCPAFRSVNLLPRTGHGVYRSYFLSDMDRKMIAQHCVTSKGKWHPDTTCYTVDGCAGPRALSGLTSSPCVWGRIIPVTLVCNDDSKNFLFPLLCAYVALLGLCAWGIGV